MLGRTSRFSILGGTSSVRRTFWTGPVKKPACRRRVQFRREHFGSVHFGMAHFERVHLIQKKVAVFAGLGSFLKTVFTGQAETIGFLLCASVLVVTSSLRLSTRP